MLLTIVHHGKVMKYVVLHCTAGYVWSYGTKSILFEIALA